MEPPSQLLSSFQEWVCFSYFTSQDSKNYHRMKEYSPI